MAKTIRRSEGVRFVNAQIASLADLPPFAEDAGETVVNVIIETPRGSRHKFDFDPKRRLFKLAGTLPAGHTFPFDFGFVPSTLGDDGDPLDILVLMDAAAFAGCLVPCRLIGVIEAEQTEHGATERNDRLLAVATNSITHRSLRDLSDVNDDLLGQIEHTVECLAGMVDVACAFCQVLDAEPLVEQEVEVSSRQQRRTHGQSFPRMRSR